MAFGKKFYSSYKSNNNLDYYLEIWIDGHTGGNTELTMGAGGPVIEYETDQEDRFSPIISSSCKIPYLVEDNIDSAFVDTLRTTYQERQVYIHIYRASSSTYHTVAPLWSGFLVMDLGEGQDKSFPYVQELKFVDGLALLKDIDFVDLNVAGGTPPFEERVQGNYVEENMYFGPATYIYWFREILAKTGASLTAQGSTLNYGFTTSVNWYNGDMNSTGQSSDPLHKTKCQVSMFHRKDDQEVYFPDNCYNVLKELLRHWGARITYWKHEFYIVQIPEYITGESGTIDNPQNNFSRVYSNTGSYQGSQDHLGSTYWTRYFQEISNTKISKLTGTKYEYLPIVKQVNADFLSFSSKSVFGGFPFGATALQQEVFQGTLNSPSTADFLWLSIPLDWAWDCPNFPSGHTNGWWSSIKFNFYASDGTTTYYLQFDSTSQTLPYYWVDSANWTPLGNRSPRYVISSKSLNVTAHVGFEQRIPFKDSSGNAITMTGAWSFYLDLHSTGTSTGYGNSGSNPGCFYLNFSGYGSPQRMRNPNVGIVLPTPSGNLNSGTVSWSNSLQDSQGSITISTITNPSGFNAGTSQDDIRFATTSPFLGLLQLLTDGQSAAFGQSYNTLNTSSAAAKANSDQFDFGRLLWGDSTEFARSSLQVFDGSNYVNTTASGLWGRGTLTGSKTFTQLLLDEFLYGQTKIIISPSMRLIVGEQNKNETQGSATRPRYVNPIGKLRETRDGTDPEYFFRRGSFYTLLDEWDYEGYQIIRNEVTTTNQNNSIGSSGGNQSNAPNNSAMITNPTTQALAQNSPLAYISQTIPATGSNVAVNGNFNVATGWTLGTGWTIDTTEKKAKFAATGSTSELVQSVLTQELTYQINFQVEVTAGTLLVKAGTSGQTQTITSSGDYSIYLTCEGSSDIKFQAGTTFTGSITYITLRDQKSLSSVPINEIGSAVFKTGDTFNLINSNSDEILALTVTSNQGSSDTSISVSSTPLYDDIDAGSYLLINQDDLSAQYQNKTKGTVGGFDITATSIDSGSVAISSYIDDDSFATASATSLATSESIKAYVDPKGEKSVIQIRNDEGITIPAGAPIYSKGEIGGSERILVGICDGGDSSKMPCIGIVETELNTTDNKDGFATTQGVFNTNISGFTSLSEGDILYVNSGSPPYLTQTKPTNGDLIQNVGVVIKTNGTICQGLLVAAIGRTNDVPWPLYVDHTNQRVSIGTTSPSFTLDVDSGTANAAFRVLSTDRYTGIRFEDSLNNDILFYDGQNDLMFLGSTSFRAANLISNGYLRIGADNKILSDGSVEIAIDYNNNQTDRVFKITKDNSSELFRVQENGNVGIGTSSPSSPLTIKSNSTSSSDSGFTLQANSNTNAIFKVAEKSTDGARLHMYDGGVEKIAFYTDGTANHISAGNVGIGTTSPNFLLDVESSGASARVYNTTGSTSLQIQSQDNANGSIDFADSSDNNVGQIIYRHASNSMAFNTNDTEKMRLTSDGRLGIGTSNPSRFLSVNSANENFVAQFTSNDDKASILLEDDDTLNYIHSQDGYLSIGGGNALSTTNLNINSTNGNVGIGTSSPVSKLHIYEDSTNTNSSAGITVENDGTGDAVVQYLLTGSRRWVTGIDNSNNDAFAISSSLDLGSDRVLTLTTGGNATFSGDGDIITAQRGTFTVKTSLTSVNHNIFSTGKAFNIGTTDSQGLFFITNNSVKMNITSGGNVLIGTTTDSGYKLTVNGDIKLNDNAIRIGSSSLGDLKLYHDGNNSYISQNGVGHLYIENNTDGQDVIFRCDNGTGGTTDYFKLDGGDAIIKYLKDTKYLDSVKATFGNSNDLQIYHNGTDSVIDNLAGDFYITQTANDKDIIFQSDDGSGGTTPYITLDGSSVKTKFDKDLLLKDSVALQLGTDTDAALYHSGGEGSFVNYTGNFRFIQGQDNGDIQFFCDDGSGGTTPYITLDGSQTTVNVSQNLLINTTTDVGVPLYVNGVIRAVGGGIQAAQDYGFTLNDESGSNRYGLKFGAAGSVGGSNLLMLTNRSFNSATGGGEVAIGGNSNTSGVTEVEIARFIPRVTATSGTQKKVSLDAVLELTEQTAPANPASGESIIWMDSESGDLKVKINYGGTTVTRTLAAFEG